jgi:hypothetical protein
MGNGRIDGLAEGLKLSGDNINITLPIFYIS